MTDVSARPPDTRTQAARSPGPLTAPLLGTIAIASMWLAVLFASVYGADIVSENGGGQSTRIPSGVFVALFATLATVAVARRVFARPH